MGLWNRIFGGKSKEEEKTILNNTVMAKKSNRILISTQDYFIHEKRVSVSLVQDPHYALEIITFKATEKKEKAYEQKEVEEEIKFFDLKRNDGEEDREYSARKVAFDRVMMLRLRGQNAEMPEGLETEEKTAKVKKMAVVEVDKITTVEKEEDVKKVDIYFRPQPQQIIEFLRNYLNANI